MFSSRPACMPKREPSSKGHQFQRGCLCASLKIQLKMGQRQGYSNTVFPSHCYQPVIPFFSHQLSSIVIPIFTASKFCRRPCPLPSCVFVVVPPYCHQTYSIVVLAHCHHVYSIVIPIFTAIKFYRRPCPPPSCVLYRRHLLLPSSLFYFPLPLVVLCRHPFLLPSNVFYRRPFFLPSKYSIVIPSHCHHTAKSLPYHSQCLLDVVACRYLPRSTANLF